MPIADRPVSGASIESVWGQQVHDYTFAPAGCEVAGTGTLITTTIGIIDLSSVVDDPGGYLDAANDQIEVPTNGEGLYLMTVRWKSGDGITGQGARGAFLVNGSYVAFSEIDLTTSEVTPLPPIALVLQLTAGDILKFAAKRTGSAGGAPYVNVESCQLVRLGAEYGTP